MAEDGGRGTSYGKEIKKVRVDAGETLGQMAKKLRVSVSYLSSIENGLREVPAGFSYRISQAYALGEDGLDRLITAESRTPHKSISFDLGDVAREPAYVRAALYYACLLGTLEQGDAEELCEELRNLAARRHRAAHILKDDSMEALTESYTRLTGTLAQVQEDMAAITERYNALLELDRQRKEAEAQKQPGLLKQIAELKEALIGRNVPKAEKDASENA